MQKSERVKMIKYTAILLLFFSSCNLHQYSSQRAAKKIGKVAAVHPTVLATICAANFPINKKDSVVTIYTPGKVITLPGDTVIVNCDSIIKAEASAKTPINPAKVKVNCPPSTHQVDTIYNGEFVVEENTALADSWRGKYEEKNEALSDAVRYSQNLFKWLLFVGLLAAVLGIILIIKK